MFITSNLDQDQEEKLFDLLRENKEVLGLTLVDSKDIILIVV